MELAGKTKEDFDKWLIKEDNYGLSEVVDTNDFGYDLDDIFPNLPFSAQWGLYVDFFDSVGIYIEDWVAYDSEAKKCQFEFCIQGPDIDEEFIEFFDNRKDSRIAALNHAIKIYNSK